MYEILIGLCGVFAGIALARISPEELAAGEKYFRFLKTTLFLGILGGISLFGLLKIETMFVTIFIVVCIILFALNLKIRRSDIEFLNYFVFAFPVFLIPEQNFRLVMSSLIFLYGLPAGTLIQNDLWKT